MMAQGKDRARARGSVSNLRATGENLMSMTRYGVKVYEPKPPPCAYCGERYGKKEMYRRTVCRRTVWQCPSCYTHTQS